MSAFDECLRGFVSRINQEPECWRSTIVLFRHYSESSVSCLLACLLACLLVEAGSTKDSLVTSRSPL